MCNSMTPCVHLWKFDWFQTWFQQFQQRYKDVRVLTWLAIWNLNHIIVFYRNSYSYLSIGVFLSPGWRRTIFVSLPEGKDLILVCIISKGTININGHFYIAIQQFCLNEVCLSYHYFPQKFAKKRYVLKIPSLFWKNTKMMKRHKSELGLLL